MSNRRLSKTFLSISVLSATSEASSFPRANIVDRTSPQRAWRSTGIGSDHRVVIDLGATQTDITCYMDYVNFETFKFQESANGTSGWADIGSLRTVEMDPMHGVYRRVDDITLTGKRYLGIYIPAQTPVDGASYFRIGTFCIPTGILEPDFPETEVGFPLEYAIPEAHVENRFPGGQTEKIPLGQLQPLVISFSMRTTVNANIAGTTVQNLADMLRDPTRMLFLDFNLGVSSQAYLVKKAGEFRVSLNAPAVNTLETGAMLFEVVT